MKYIIVFSQRTSKLQDYRQSHPEVTVLDPPDAIQHLHNRQYMLQEVADMNFSDSYGTINWFFSLLKNHGNSSFSL